MALIFEMLTSKLSVVRMGGREIHLLDASVAASPPHGESDLGTRGNLVCFDTH